MVKYAIFSVIALAIVFSFSLSFPGSANAGVFSFISQMLGASAPATESASVINSQNMPLLQAALNPDPNPAKGGGDISVVGNSALLPESGPAGTAADIADNSAVPEQISLYVVRKGDSLSQIAKMFGVSVNTIIWANDLKNQIISEGQTLIILPISGVRHIAKKGDTLPAIAKQYKADLKEILQFNNLSADSKLAEGDVVIIPDGEVANSNYATKAKLRGAGGPDYAGYYMRPILGGRLSQGLHGYNGVDLATYYGAPIFASAEGQVLIARAYGWNGGYGEYVVISHPNGTQTLYGHMSNVVAYDGQYVVRGEVIGYIGSTGKSTGPHLHFEVRGARNPFQ